MRLLAAAFVMMVAFVALPTGAFASEQHPTQSEVEGLLICLQCHEPIDESTSILAQRMKAQVRQDIAAGWTRSQILDSFENQWGPGVLAVPRKHGFDLVAWLLPFAAIIAGAIGLGYGAWYWSRNREQAATAPVSVSPELDRRIDDELAHFDS